MKSNPKTYQSKLWFCFYLENISLMLIFDASYMADHLILFLPGEVSVQALAYSLCERDGILSLDISSRKGTREDDSGSQ